MSQFDETDYDEEEMNNPFEEDALTQEEIFQMVMINKNRGTTVRIELHDEEGNEVKLPEIIEQLAGYIVREITSAEESQFSDQIMPLMGQSVATGLYEMFGAVETAHYVTNKFYLDALVRMMSIAFLLLKYVQQNKLTIKTFEEEVSEEELESIERKSALTSITMSEVLNGQDPRKILDALIQAGKITQVEVDEILKNVSDEDFEY